MNESPTPKPYSPGSNVGTPSMEVRGYVIVEWDPLADVVLDPEHPASPWSKSRRYFGHGEINGVRVWVEGNFDDTKPWRRVRLVIRTARPR